MQVGPVPVARWGTAQEGHHHIMGVCVGQLQKGVVQPVLSRRIRVGCEPPVDAPHDAGHLEETWLRAGVLPERAISPASPEKCFPSHCTGLA